MDLNKKIAVIEDDKDFSFALSNLLKTVSLIPLCYDSSEDFLTKNDSDIDCIISDIRLPGMSGLLLQKELNKRFIDIPVIIISAYADVEMAVQAMKQGALTVLTKPIKNQELLDAIFNAIKIVGEARDFDAHKFIYDKKLKTLTAKEHDIFELIIHGLPSKCIADQLAICKNTVDVHRANLMKKMSSPTLGDLIKHAILFEAVKIKPNKSNVLL